MRPYDFAPLYRSTVGFDRLFDMLDNAGRPDWPPYNIEKQSENEYRISMAIAGFGTDDIELVQNGPELIVVGQKKVDEDERQILHQGLALRNFRHTFKLADYVKVASAALANGLLSVDLVREIPEELKPRRIEIASDAKQTKPEASQIEQDGDRRRKAA